MWTCLSDVLYCTGRCEHRVGFYIRLNIVILCNILISEHNEPDLFSYRKTPISHILVCFSFPSWTSGEAGNAKNWCFYPTNTKHSNRTFKLSIVNILWFLTICLSCHKWRFRLFHHVKLIINSKTSIFFLVIVLLFSDTHRE